MPAPKRRTGESLANFNKRRVAYYANRRALENGFSNAPKPSRLRNPANSNRFYAEDRRQSSKRPSGDRNIWDGEEDVDIRDLTADSPESRKYSVSDIDDWDGFVKSNTPKPPRLRNPANGNNRYAEDRRQESRRPSGDTNIWRGTPSEYVYDDFAVDDSWIRGNADTAQSASRSPAVKNGEQRVMEKNDRNISAKMNPGKRAVLTPGDYTKKIGNYKKESISGSTPVAKLNPINRGSALSASTNNTEQKGNRKEVREGTMNRMGSSPRQTLENGFREEEEKKKKSGSTGFRGIRP